MYFASKAQRLFFLVEKEKILHITIKQENIFLTGLFYTFCCRGKIKIKINTFSRLQTVTLV